MKWSGLLLAGLFTVAAHASQLDHKFRAVYFVPTAVQDLVKYSVFDVGLVSLKEKGDEVELRYYVPVELTGAYNEMKFRGRRVASGVVELKSDDSVMECPALGDYSACGTGYRGLQFDAKERQKLLRELSRSEEEFQAREALALQFQADVEAKPVQAFATISRLFRGGEPHGFLKLLE